MQKRHTAVKHVRTDSSNEFAPSSNAAFDLLKMAIRAVPAVKYALGITGTMAALALGKALFSTAKLALLSSVAMLVLMFLLLLFSAATKLAPTFLQKPALVLTWAILSLFVLSAALCVTSIFFDWPQTFPKLTANFLASYEKPPILGNDPLVAPIIGMVFDEAGQLIAGVTVTMHDSQVTTTTDSSGSFSLKLHTTTQIDFSKHGYKSGTFNLEPGTNPKITLHRLTK